jgi:hypothetical protein
MSSNYCISPDLLQSQPNGRDLNPSSQSTGELRHPDLVHPITKLAIDGGRFPIAKLFHYRGKQFGLTQAFFRLPALRLANQQQSGVAD